MIALHLLPGLIFAGFFFILSSVFVKHGLTGYLALLVSIPVCLAPIELGVMFFWSVRVTGRKSLLQAIAYRRQGTAVEYIVLPLFLFICWGVLSIAINPMGRGVAGSNAAAPTIVTSRNPMNPKVLKLFFLPEKKIKYRSILCSQSKRLLYFCVNAFNKILQFIT